MEWRDSGLTFGSPAAEGVLGESWSEPSRIVWFEAVLRVGSSSTCPAWPYNGPPDRALRSLSAEGVLPELSPLARGLGHEASGG